VPHVIARHGPRPQWCAQQSDAITAFVPGRAAVDLQLVFWLCQQHGPRHFLDLEF
jgi:hypothetical protein